MADFTKEELVEIEYLANIALSKKMVDLKTAMLESTAEYCKGRIKVYESIIEKVRKM